MSAKFTFFAESDKIEVKVVELENHVAANESRTVWLDSTVTIEAGAFLGSFKASFTSDDLVRLHNELKSVLRSPNGTVIFQPSGGGLSLSINIEGNGKTSITGLAQPKRLRQGVLQFNVDLDRFALTRTVHEIEGTLREFCDL